MRIPITGSNPKAKHIETRFPDPSATPYLIDTWITDKHDNEIAPVQLRPHPHESELYYDI